MKTLSSNRQFLSFIKIKKANITFWIVMFILPLLPLIGWSQNTVTIGGENLNEKAVLKLVAPNGDQGFLLPIIEDKSLINPGPNEAGMVIYDKVVARLFFWNGTEWLPLGFNLEDDTASITALKDVSETQAINGQILQWSDSIWIPEDLTAPKVFYDNSFSGLGASDVQSAIDALSGSAGVSQWLLDNDNIYFNKKNVGIGRTLPTAKLHIALDSVDTSPSKGLVIENNSKSSSALYGSQLLLTGNSNSQKIGEYINVENGTNSKIGQGIIVKQEANQVAYGQNIQVTGTSTTVSAGSYIVNGGTGTGDKYGILSGVGGENSKNTGLYTYVNQGSGTGVHSLISNTSGPSTGIYSEITNTTSPSSKGFHSKIVNGGKMVGYESEIVQGNDISRSYGVKTDIINDSSFAETYGLYSTISGAGNGELYGLYSDVIGTGMGNKYGLWSQVYGGEGTKTGMYSKVIQQQDVESYGYYADVQNTGNFSTYGTYITMSGYGGGTKYGAYYLLEEETNTPMMGSSALLLNKGAGRATGYKAEIAGDGQGEMFGFYSTLKGGISSKTGFRSYIEQNEIKSTVGYESIIEDHSERKQGVIGTTGIRLEVISTNDAVHYGINSSGDDLNVFDGSIKIGGSFKSRFWTISPNPNNYNLEFLFGEPTSSLVGYITSIGQYVNASDRRLKQNITGMGSVLDKVSQLKPSYYYFKNDSAHALKIGFIAQDVELLFPELVEVSEGNGFDDFHSLYYDGFGVLSIKAIQEQQDIILEQAKKIDSLEDRLSKLEKLLNK